MQWSPISTELLDATGYWAGYDNEAPVLTQDIAERWDLVRTLYTSPSVVQYALGLTSPRRRISAGGYSPNP